MASVSDYIEEGEDGNVEGEKVIGDVVASMVMTSHRDRWVVHVEQDAWQEMTYSVVRC